MNKRRVSKILLFFILLISISIALEWDFIIDLVDKVTKETGLKTPAYLLTILEKETKFAQVLGSNLGDKDKNINRCVKYCDYLLSLDPPIKGVNCDSETARRSWCTNQYNTLEKITTRLGLDINKVPFSPDFGIGYTQFQPTTWEMYPELKNKNPWKLEDALYATAIKILKDGIHSNERKAVWYYNQNEDYINNFIDKRVEWDQIISDTAFIFDCSSNDYSCSLAKLKTEFDDCTENNWSIQQKKECIKNKVAFYKQEKIARLQEKREKIIITLISLNYYNSTPAYIGQSIQNQNENQKQSVSFKEKTINQPSITYKEEIKTINTQNLTNNQQINSNNSTKFQTTTSPTTKTTLTTNTTTLISRQQIVPTSTNNTNSQLTYLGGGEGDSSVSQSPKDLCENYKNNQYPNILISEIQFETENDTKDEFIELYNPTDQEIDLTCWRLEKYASKDPNSTSTPTLTTLIPQSKFRGKIKPFSFFLITSSSTKEKYQGDLSYAGSYSIAKNNVIILRKPNNEISDLIGYGDNEEKIYQAETKPFLRDNFQNKSIQRKNLQDTGNNFEDFWLRIPNPENSNSQARTPREDFLDLAKIQIENFQVFPTSTEESTFLTLLFQEPTTSVSSTNYSYNLLISTSTNFNTFYLSDFGINENLPQPKFDSSNTTLTFEITKCPTTSTLYYFGLYLKDNLDDENKSPLSIASTTLPDYLCNPERPAIPITVPGKILFSEVRVMSGTSTGEYIELYNPNDFDINLTGWKLIRYNSKGSTSTIASNRAEASFKNIILPSFHYLLLSNTSTLTFADSYEVIEINADLIYAESHDLTKNNTLKLIAPNGEVIDEISWNDSSEDKSYTRKKTNLTHMADYYCSSPNPKDYFFCDKYSSLGNAYDTNSPDDFILIDPNPRNLESEPLKAPKWIIKYGIDFNKTNENIVLINIRWLSPAFYDDGYHYELEIGTSTSSELPSEFYPAQNYFTFTLPPFRLLTYEEITLEGFDPEKLGLPENTNYSSIIFKLILKKNDQIIDEVMIFYRNLA